MFITEVVVGGGFVVEWIILRVGFFYLCFHPFIFNFKWSGQNIITTSKQRRTKSTELFTLSLRLREVTLWKKKWPLVFANSVFQSVPKARQWLECRVTGILKALFSSLVPSSPRSSMSIVLDPR